MNSFIKNIVEGFDFNAAAGKQRKSDNIIKAVKAAYNIVEMCRTHNVSDDYLPGGKYDDPDGEMDNHFDVYKDDDTNAEYLYISVDFEPELSGYDTVKDEGEGAEYFDNFNFKGWHNYVLDFTHGIAYYQGVLNYLRNYPLKSTDKDIMDFNVEDYMKYIEGYTEEDIQEALDWEKEKLASQTKEREGRFFETRPVHEVFERCYEALLELKRFYKDVFANLSETQRRALIYYLKDSIHFLDNMYISFTDDGMLYAYKEFNEAESEEDVSNVYITIRFTGEVNNDKVLNKEWTRKFEPRKEIKDFNLYYYKYYYINNKWEEFHPGRKME